VVGGSARSLGHTGARGSTRRCRASARWWVGVAWAVRPTMLARW